MNGHRIAVGHGNGYVIRGHTGRQTFQVGQDGINLLYIFDQDPANGGSLTKC